MLPLYYVIFFHWNWHTESMCHFIISWYKTSQVVLWLYIPYVESGTCSIISEAWLQKKRSWGFFVSFYNDTHTIFTDYQWLESESKTASSRILLMFQPPFPVKSLWLWDDCPALCWSVLLCTCFSQGDPPAQQEHWDLRQSFVHRSLLTRKCFYCVC